MTPTLKFGVNYDMKKDDNNTVVNIQNSISTSSSYTSYGNALSRMELIGGFGVKFDLKNNIEFLADYNGKFREDYTDHTGMFTAKYKF